MAAASGAFLAIGVLISMCVPTQNVRYYLPLCAAMGIVCGLAGRFTVPDRARADLPGGTLEPLRRIEQQVLPWALQGLLLAAICHWAIYVFAVQPYRAAKDSLRPAAERFASHMPEGAIIWTDVGDSYSSLFFYMDRPVQNFSLSAKHPKPGDFVVLESDQLSALDSRADSPYTVIERAPIGSRELILVRMKSLQ
jgi:hypothetical protein